MTVDEALALWQSKAAIIIDIRTREEYLAGHIPGVNLVSFDELEHHVSEIPENEKVLLICRSGNRSARAASLLKNKGFDNVDNVDGGMQAWPGPVVK
jgi:phage shock protein E